jgi:hypothetical protein
MKRKSLCFITENNYEIIGSLQNKLLIIFILFLTNTLLGQETLKIKNGVSVPTRDTIYGLIIFAEVDFSEGGCPCGDTLPDDFGKRSSWPKKDGKTLIPNDAHTYLNSSIEEFFIDPAYITDIYYQASYGEYVMLGDYFPEVITVKCNEVRRGNDGVNLIINKLNELPDSNGTLYTARGFPLEHFDRWTSTNQGLPKIKDPDGRVDMFYVIWKNNRFLNSCHTQGNAGFGLSASRGIPLKNLEGINTRASYNAVNSAPSGYTIMLMEHMHGIFGGNHWHSGGGEGFHSVIAIPSNYGLTAQFDTPMRTFCAWDRWMMDWQGNREYLISALDEEGNMEVNTETISINTHKDGLTIILRDFKTTGDALRIKLPHIDYEKDGIKNQYIWFENRRMKNRFEQYLSNECSNRLSAYPNGTPGIYAYHQIGKDVKEGGNEIYATFPYSHPNALGSYLVPFNAEGNYDYHFRRDLLVPASPNLGCGHWGNANIPIHRSKNLDNPLTGFNDMFITIDGNNDGTLYFKDRIQTGLSEVYSGDSVVHNYFRNGDWKDPFTKITGKTKIYLASNPAPVPIYTYRSGNAYTSPARQAPEDFENRKVDLNGLAIEILDEDALGDGSGAMKVKISWDNYIVDKNVRWCGNIRLHPNDFDIKKPSLQVKRRKKILLERGQSPTYYKAEEFDDDKNPIFTDSTLFQALPNSFVQLEKRARVTVNEGSTLHFQSQSSLTMESRSRIVLQNPGDKLIIDAAANLNLHKRAFLFIGKKKFRLKSYLEELKTSQPDADEIVIIN